MPIRQLQPINNPGSSDSSSEGSGGGGISTPFSGSGGQVVLPSTLETIDTGLYEYINEKFDIFSETNEGWKKVPVLWMATERVFQIKNDKDLRDSAGRLILPLITIERTSISKDPGFKGAVQADIPPEKSGPRGYRGGSLPIARNIVQDKTRNHANADSRRKKGEVGSKNVGNGQETFKTDNKKIVYEEVFMPIPTYITIIYTLTLRAEYQQQMNTMLTPFITKTGQINSFVFEKDNNRYEAFIQQDYGQNNNLSNLGEDERAFMSKIEIKVLGYLTGDEKNEDQPFKSKRETIVEIKLVRERTIVGDKKPWLTDNNNYRE